MTRALITVAALIAGCDQGSSKKTVAPAPTTEKHEFYGIRYDTPVGASMSNSGTSSPSGPGDTNPVRPGVVVIVPNTHRLFLEITKEPSPLTLEGYKYAMTANAAASKAEGVTTARGWDMTYVWTVAPNPPTTMYVRYAAFGPGEQYNCIYDDQSSKDLAAAEAICRSIARK